MDKKKKGIEWHLFGFVLSILSLVMYYLAGNNVLVGWILAIICFGYFVCLCSGHGKILSIVTSFSTLLLVFVISLISSVGFGGGSLQELGSYFQTLCMLLPMFKIILFFIYLFFSLS